MTVHNEALQLLKFTVSPLRSGYYELRRDGVKFGRHGLCDEDAWAQAPSIHDLRNAIEIAIVGGVGGFGFYCPYKVLLYTNAGEWKCDLITDGAFGYTVKCAGSGKDPDHAYISLFIAACKADLIKPDSVKLE